MPSIFPSPTSDQPDFSRFSTPIWPKSHTIHKTHSDLSSYPYATQKDLDEEPSTLLRRHHPLKQSGDGTGRLAGTHGRSDYVHSDDPSSAEEHLLNRPDDVGKDVLGTLQGRSPKDSPKWSSQQVERVKRLLERAQGTGKDRDEALQALFDDPALCLSIREVKELVKDWKLEDPLVSVFLLSVGRSRRGSGPVRLIDRFRGWGNSCTAQRVMSSRKSNAPYLPLPTLRDR